MSCYKSMQSRTKRRREGDETQEERRRVKRNAGEEKGEVREG